MIQGENRTLGNAEISITNPTLQGQLTQQQRPPNLSLPRQLHSSSFQNHRSQVEAARYRHLVNICITEYREESTGGFGLCTQSRLGRGSQYAYSG